MEELDILFICKKCMALMYTSWISLLVFLIGGFDLLFISLICLMALDFISGLMVGYKTKTLNSSRGAAGLKKKVMTLVLVCSASVMDRLIPGVGIRTVVCIFYSSIETLSILENAGKYGIPIPEKLRDALEQCKKK